MSGVLEDINLNISQLQARRVNDATTPRSTKAVMQLPFVSSRHSTILRQIF